MTNSRSAFNSLTIRPSITILVAQFGSSRGTFNSVATPRSAFTNAQCYALGPPSQDFTATTLSTTISVTPLCAAGGTSASGGGLSVGAIAGIAVGCVVGGLLIALAIVVLMVLQRRRRDVAFKQSMHSVRRFRKPSFFLSHGLFRKWRQGLSV